MSTELYVIRIADPNGERDTVHVGPYPTTADADRMAGSIEAQLASAGSPAETYVEHVYSSLDLALYRYREGHDKPSAVQFVATMNTPGYRPSSDDEPPVFDMACEAWSYLAEERERQEEDCDDGDSSSDTAVLLNALARAGTDQSDTGLTEAEEWRDAGLAPDGTGTVYGDTPGYDGSHDLGIAYNVTLAERES